MKFSCAQCGAKYSVSDPRVAGKVVQVRCKSCSARIVVRGTQPQPDNDTSALFDLRQLWAFAEKETKPESPAEAGSGLIDIAALSAARSKPEPEVESPGQTLTFAPVLARGTPEPNPRSRLAFIGGLLAVSAVGLLAALTVVLLQRPEPRASAATPTPRVVTVERIAVTATEAPTDTETPTDTDTPTDTETDTPTGTETPTTVSRQSERASMRRVRRPPVVPEEPAERAEPESLRELIDQAALDPHPARDDVRSALRAVATQAVECGRGTTGVARATVVFAGSGRVRRVDVTGVPARARRCVARAVRTARVQPFRRPTFRVTFPFRVR